MGTHDQARSGICREGVRRHDRSGSRSNERPADTDVPPSHRPVFAAPALSDWESDPRRIPRLYQMPSALHNGKGSHSRISTIKRIADLQIMVLRHRFAIAQGHKDMFISTY